MKNSLVKIGASLSAFAVTAGAAFAAEGSAVIPNLSCDISQFITTAIQNLAVVVGVAVGGYVAFLIVRRGLRWLGTALR